MAKLSHEKAKLHLKACEMLAKGYLTFEEKWFVLENWHEGATNLNGEAGAFFTPPSLARDFQINMGYSPSIIDLCAGIGTLAFMAWHSYRAAVQKPPRIVCVEKNPAYVAVGRLVLPEAEWIEGDIFDLPANIGHFALAIGNPPFGKAPKQGRAPRYTGPAFEFHAIDVASDIADSGVFLIPQQSAPFKFSGVTCFKEQRSAHHEAFRAQTLAEIECTALMDTSYHRAAWHFTVPPIEIVTLDFTEARQARAALAAAKPCRLSHVTRRHVPAGQLDLFGGAMPQAARVAA